MTVARKGCERNAERRKKTTTVPEEEKKARDFDRKLFPSEFQQKFHNLIIIVTEKVQTTVIKYILRCRI